LLHVAHPRDALAGAINRDPPEPTQICKSIGYVHKPVVIADSGTAPRILNEDATDGVEDVPPGRSSVE
jgi:hypothetical protein